MTGFLRQGNAKRVLGVLVLSAVMLQGANRTGVLNYLYAQRFEIAYALHLTAEKPIAECSSRYYDSTELRIQLPAENAKAPVLASAEINLVFPAAVLTARELDFSVVKAAVGHYVCARYSAVIPSLFHPPGN